MSGVMPFTKRYTKKTTFSLISKILYIKDALLLGTVKFAILLFGLFVGIFDGQLINSFRKISVPKLFDLSADMIIVCGSKTVPYNCFEVN